MILSHWPFKDKEFEEAYGNLDVIPEDNKDEVFEATKKDHAFDDSSLNESPETVQLASSSSFACEAKSARPWMLTETGDDFPNPTFSNPGTRRVRNRKQRQKIYPKMTMANKTHSDEEMEEPPFLFCSPFPLCFPNFFSSFSLTKFHLIKSNEFLFTDLALALALSPFPNLCLSFYLELL